MACHLEFLLRWQKGQPGGLEKNQGHVGRLAQEEMEHCPNVRGLQDHQVESPGLVGTILGVVGKACCQTRALPLALDRRLDPKSRAAVDPHKSCLGDMDAGSQELQEKGSALVLAAQLRDELEP